MCGWCHAKLWLVEKMNAGDGDGDDGHHRWHHFFFREVRWGRMGSSWTGIELYYTPGSLSLIIIIIIITIIIIIIIMATFSPSSSEGMLWEQPVPCDQSNREFRECFLCPFTSSASSSSLSIIILFIICLIKTITIIIMIVTIIRPPPPQQQHIQSMAWLGNVFAVTHLTPHINSTGTTPSLELILPLNSLEFFLVYLPKKNI